MKPILLLSLLALPACTNDPFIRKPDGTTVSLGQTWFKKETGVNKGYEGPEGKLWVNRVSGDETVIPGKLINYYGIKSAINGATAALRTTESTKRILSGHEVSKHATTSAADVEKLKILNPVEEVAPAVIPAP